LHCRHLLCPKSRFAKLSRVKHQMGSHSCPNYDFKTDANKG
jgi:hypothetical protein